MYAIGLMVFILFWVAVIWIWWRARDFDRARSPTLADALAGLRAYQSKTSPDIESKIVFRDRVYASLADMHPDDRREYQELHSKPPISSEPEPPVAAPTDPAETLRKLRDMKYAGLISADDYEAKKAEILARM